MIQVKLYHDQYAKMQHEKTLDRFFPKNSVVMECKMSEGEFDQFLKASDMITYKHLLKTYQDGQICGEFTVLDH